MSGTGTPVISGGTGTPVQITNAAGASSTVTGPDAFGASSTAGSATTYSRGDHDHGLPANKQVWMFALNETVATTLQLFAGGAAVAFTPPSKGGSVVPVPGTVKNLNVMIETNSLSAADTYTVTLYTGTVAGSLSASALKVQFAGGTTGIQTDSTHSVSIAANTIVAIGAIANAGTGTLTIWVTVEFDQSG